MTKIRNLGLFLVMSSFLWVSSCSDDDVTSPVNLTLNPNTIGDIVESNGSLSTLQTALGAASTDFSAILDGSEPVTLFAPTNAAFDAFAAEAGFASVADLVAAATPEQLSLILSYHVVAGNVGIDDLTEGIALTTVQGGEIDVTSGAIGDDEFIQLLDARELPQTRPVSNIRNTDARAANGVVHFIDQVLLPQEAIEALNIDIRPRIVDWATGTEDLSLLVDALVKTELVATVTALDSATVLAPTNAAFADLLNLLGDDYESLDDFDNEAEIALLTDILTYHVLPETFVITADSTDTALEDNPLIITAAGDDFVFMDASGLDANPEGDLIEARNGFVQIIDKVLLPQSVLDFAINLGRPDLATIVTTDDELSILAEALIATELDDEFIDDTNIKPDTTATNFTYVNPVTVFAPTDDAFNELLNLMGEDYTGIDSFDTEDEIELLTNILLYHVVPGRINAEDLEAGMVTTATGANVEVIAAIGAPGTFVIGDASNNINANILLADVSARNGVAHVVDKVLLSRETIEFINALNEDDDEEDDTGEEDK